MKEGNLIYGVGINDADYIVRKVTTVGYTEKGKRIQKQTWICPFYCKWNNMLQRCYSDNYHSRQPTYIGCSVVPEWHYFMTFKAWMEKQDWQGKQLDKDLLFPGNKIYGPDACVFIDSRVNSFLSECTAARGEWPIGVDFHKHTGKYQARCRDVTTGDKKYLGLYSEAEDAYNSWLSFKKQQAEILASQQSDQRVAKALIERYENYVGH